MIFASSSSFLHLEERILAEPIGYHWLISEMGVNVPDLETVSFLGDPGASFRLRHPHQAIKLFRKEYAVPPDPLEHLVFAIKHEHIDLPLIQKVFEKLEQSVVSDFVMKNPRGIYERRIGFLYEFLTGKNLGDPGIDTGNYVELLDSKKYFAGSVLKNKKWRIDDNLLGDSDFCPVVRKTPRLEGLMNKNLGEKARALLEDYPSGIVHRANQYLYVKETKSSFLIEREEPGENRLERFVNLLRQSRSYPFENKNDFVRIQNAIVDPRFANSDYRKTQNYVGQTLRGGEIIHYIPPSPDHVGSMMEGLIRSLDRMRRTVHPVVQAAVISFGFVFIHPFDDGNGRLHRFLIHQILSREGFTPDQAIFPVSAHILSHMEEYNECLESFSRRIMGMSDYSLDAGGTLAKKNDPVSFYRYFDATKMAEYLFGVIENVIDGDLKEELQFLVRYDNAKKDIQDRIDMPDRLIDLFIRFSLQNDGTISNSKRKSHFESLTEEEVGDLQNIVKSHFKKDFDPVLSEQLEKDSRADESPNHSRNQDFEPGP